MLGNSYVASVEENLNAVLNQLDSIKQAAEMITRVIPEGKKVFIVDKYGIADSELVDRASGLALFRSLKNDMLDLSEGDILILSAYHPDDADEIKYLTDAHEKGAKVITISPRGGLAQQADLALLNNDNSENGVINILGIEPSFCPVSGIVNVTIAWSIAAEITALLVSEGKIPSVTWGDYLAGGKEKQFEARKRFSSLGY